MKITIEIDNESVAEMTAEAAEAGLTVEEVAWLHIRALRAAIQNPEIPAGFVKEVLLADQEGASDEFKFG